MSASAPAKVTLWGILTALLLAVPGAPAAAAQSFPELMATVDTCLGATGSRAVDAARLARDGWTEQSIDNVESSPTPYRLFSKDRAGGLILFTFEADGTPHCHVLVVRTPDGAEPLASALTVHFRTDFLPGDQGPGAGASAMRVPGRPFILVLRRRPDDRDLVADIQVSPFAAEPRP